MPNSPSSKVAVAKVHGLLKDFGRRPPPVVASESEDDALPPAPRFKTKTKTRKDATVGSDASLEEESEEDDEGEEEEEDFEHLDPEELRDALIAEHAHWGTNLQDTEGDIAGDEEVGDDKPRRSKRAIDRKAEVPIWNETTSEPEEAAASDMPNPIVNVAPATTSNVPPAPNATINSQWAPEAHYTPPQPGVRNISLKDQPPCFHLVLKVAMRQVAGDIAFNNTFPPVTTLPEHLKSSLIRIAEDFDFDILSRRLKEDSVLSDFAYRALSTRISAVRGNIKKVVASKVETGYNIAGSVPERRAKAQGLLASGDYIYPRKESLNCPLRTKPYLHPIVISTIREAFFSGARGSLASKHASRFTSTITSGPQSEELELPVAMVCGAATAIYASIDDWSGGFLKRGEFNAEGYEDIYKGHVLFLNNIRADRPGAYHRLMADLYAEVSSQNGHSAHAVASSARATLDIDGMDE
ncbi:hypothetical protein H0H93_004527 [Arthromyces matolae]|nr:hypothetical protein H0H93_004527 [Arthromyces matolae]